jgi:hypothetical protein
MSLKTILFNIAFTVGLLCSATVHAATTEEILKANAEAEAKWQKKSANKCFRMDLHIFGGRRDIKAKLKIAADRTLKVLELSSANPNYPTANDMLSFSIEALFQEIKFVPQFVCQPVIKYSKKRGFPKSYIVNCEGGTGGYTIKNLKFIKCS